MQQSISTQDCQQSPNNDLLQLCKAGSDALRLGILQSLSQNAYTVQELCHILSVSQPGMSHHLKILTTAGLVTKRREGNSLFYRRANEACSAELNTLHKALLEAANQWQLSTLECQRRAQIHSDRAERSQLFFSQHAGEFSEQQEQMASYGIYGHSCLELLQNSQPNGGQLAIEIGPGEGAFLCELAPRYKNVIALDNTETMLNKARENGTKHKLNNIEFVLGESDSKDLPLALADCVISNMVLHHIANPAQIFSDAARLLKPGGIFCVTDLCCHDQNWAREACGDLWLGFEPDDLSRWANSYQLQDGPAVYLAQLNGFRVQVRQFIKPEKHASNLN